MSLYHQLRAKNSPVSKWFRTYIDDSLSRKFVQAINNEIMKYPIEITPSHTEDGMAGTAFDYAFRWLLGPLTDHIVAMKGAYFLTHKWAEAPEFISMIIQTGNAAEGLEKKAASSIVLAWFDTYLRSGKIAPPLQLLLETQHNIDWDTTYSLIPKELAEDVIQLTYAALKTWDKDLEVAFILNPTFTSSKTVDGADADWITEGILYECKSTKKNRPFDRGTLLQTLAYTFLDYDNQYDIHSLGWYYARRNLRLVYPLSEILPRLGLGVDLRALRQSFANRDQIGDIEPPVKKDAAKRRKKTEPENVRIQEISLEDFNDWYNEQDNKIKNTSIEWQPDNRRVVIVYMRDDSIEKFLVTL